MSPPSFQAMKALGQSPWCDQLSRQLLESGELARLVREDGIVGLTSNPTIFQKALGGGEWYDGEIRAAAGRGLDAKGIYEALAITDIRAVADLLESVYTSTRRGDGYVSLEVAPDLAHDTAASIEEGERLWHAVNRPNLMIKIPGTEAGLGAITALLGEGINVNVTLLFGLHRYRQVLDAHAAGLERARANEVDLEGLASVASFFVSRVDTLVDGLLDARADATGDPLERLRLHELRGKAAIAGARLAYAEWALRTRAVGLPPGARPQRLLWASTGAKNPTYRDTLYVEELLGPDTVTTLPPETITAFADHGRVAGATIDEPARVTASRQALRALADEGIDMEEVAGQLEATGVRLFSESFVALIEGVRTKTQALAQSAPA